MYVYLEHSAHAFHDIIYRYVFVIFNSYKTIFLDKTSSYMNQIYDDWWIMWKIS